MKDWPDLLRQPLVHFVVGGALLFSAYRGLGGARAPALVIDQGLQRGLAAEGRSVDRYIEEELLYREAQRLGLDRGDIIVRRRLVQNLRLLIAARQPAPSDAELDAYIAQHPERFAPAPRVDLTVELASGAVPFGRTLVGQSERELAAHFDEAFARAVFALPVAAPPSTVASPFGPARVVVTARRVAAVDPLAARAAARPLAAAERDTRAVAAAVATLRKQTPIEIAR